LHHFLLGNFIFKFIWIETLSVSLLFIIIRKDIYFLFQRNITTSNQNLDKRVNQINPIPLGLFILMFMLLFVSILGFFNLMLFFRTFFVSLSHIPPLSDIVFHIFLLLVNTIFLIISIGIPIAKPICWRIFVYSFFILVIVQFCCIVLGAYILILTFIITFVILIYITRPYIKRYYNII